LSGIALGAAYFVRHTQVLLAPALVILIWSNAAPRRLRLRALVVAGISALAVALPDLWYHQYAFGNWLTPESREMNLFSIAAIGDTISRLNTDLFAAREFGWLLPFLIYGTYRLVRSMRSEFAALVLWVLGLISFHLFYPALRLPDLLPEFPPLAIIAAYGAVSFTRALWDDALNWRKFAAATGFIFTLFMLIMRVWNVMPIPFGQPQPSFGYLSVSERASFDKIAAITPGDAVIGTTLNDGAIDLYAERMTFRTGEWNDSELAGFVQAMQRSGRRIFLLEDGTEASASRRELAKSYSLEEIAVLDVPLFGEVDLVPGILWEIRK
jgi:hypothetical protein